MDIKKTLDNTRILENTERQCWTLLVIMNTLDNMDTLDITDNVGHYYECRTTGIVLVENS